MTAYAIFVTFALGLICGVVLTVLTAEWLEARDAKKALTTHKSVKKLSERVGPNPFTRKDSDSDQMDQAVALVSDKLGATVIDQQ